MDVITGGIVKEVWRAIPQHLTKLHSRCISEGKLSGRVGAPESDPASYRGLCLLPVFGKALEAIMVNRLEEVLPLQMAIRIQAWTLRGG